MSRSSTMGIQFTGPPEMLRALDLLEDRVRKVISRKAVSMALVPMSKAAKRNCPKEMGLLKRSIGKKIKTYKSGAVWGGVGPRKETVGFGPDGRKRWPVKYAHLVEYGTKPHLEVGLPLKLPMPPNARGVTPKEGMLGMLFRTTVLHPGTAPQPFLRTAFEQTKAEMQRIMQYKVKVELQNEANRAAKSARVKR